jgi:RNA polymerase sigma-70 factor (ECF subfamily)
MEARAAAESVARRSYGRLLSILASRTRDVQAAEDALAGAFQAALESWPKAGAPDRPEAWLLTVARRNFLNTKRHNRVEETLAAHVAHLEEEVRQSEPATIPDQRLALMFACANPAIEASIRAPLILQTILGFDAKRIASAFLVAPSTVGQRLVRAKTKVREAGIAFEIPDRAELPQRLDDVLAAVYAAFSEGWSDPLGNDAERSDLADEAIYLGSLVSELLPDEAEALGLLALMLYASARRLARRSADGAFIPFDEQDTKLWDREMMNRAETILTRASKLSSIGRFQLEAALQSAHVERRLKGISNWREVVTLYDALLTLTGSPVVAINRALAIAERDGFEAGLVALPTLESDRRLETYQPYWAVRAFLSAQSGRREEAMNAYTLAIGLETDPAIRRFLQSKRDALA